MILRQAVSRRRFLTGVAAASLTACAALPGKAAGPSLAVTVDDFGLKDSPLMSAPEQDAAIRTSLRRFGLQAGAFPKGSLAEQAAVATALAAWSGEGHVIGNHTFAHAYYGGADPDAMMADVLKAEAMLAGYSAYRKWLRFPYLAEGKTAEGRDRLRALLTEAGYRTAHVTVDTSDWYISNRLAARLADNPQADISGYRDYYVAHLLDRADYYDGLMREVTGRTDVPHVILLHHNIAAALFLGDALSAFESKGWRLTGIEDAYRDPVYSAAPASLPAGQSLAWAIAQASGQHEGQLRYPAEDGPYEDGPMTAAGL